MNEILLYKEKARYLVLSYDLSYTDLREFGYFGALMSAAWSKKQGYTDVDTSHSVSVCVFSQVNGVNVVKVGHKQVVSLIRQGGNRLLMKVVSVTRKPESEEVVRKKGNNSSVPYL